MDHLATSKLRLYGARPRLTCGLLRPQGRSVYGSAWCLLGPRRLVTCQDAYFVQQFQLVESFEDPSQKDLQEAASRYLPYLARAKQLLISSTRYIAYSSDVGESLRPVLKPWQVNLSYGIAGAYVLGETAMAGHRKREQKCSKEVIAAACAHTALFQFSASLALPAVIIHSIVRQVQHVLKKPTFASWPQLLRYGPSCVGLSVVPFLPLLDPPCERVLDYLFDRFYPRWRE